jgi:DNA-binding FadR family transcriptional regulator
VEDADSAVVRQYLAKEGFTGQERLPPERELADTLGFTRNRLRRVLRGFAREGLIWRQVGNGTYFGPKLVPDELRASLGSFAVLTNPGEVMEARLLFEPRLAYSAALRGTGKHFADIRRCLDEMQMRADWNSFRVLDMQFHRLVALAAGNALLLALYNLIQANQTTEVWGRLDPAALRPIDLPIEEHERVYAALCDRDASAAEKLMRSHLQAVQDSILSR